MSRRNSNLDAITQELDRARINYVVERGRHLKVRFELLGRREMLVCAATPSHTSGERNAAARVRRMLREADEARYESDVRAGIRREVVL